MVFCEEIVKALWAMHPQRFWLIWFPITTASLIYVMSTLKPAAIPMCQKTTRASWNAFLTGRQICNLRTIVVLTLLAIFLTSYIAMIVVWEDFASYDNDLLSLYALKGHNFPLAIWRDNGRFFPFSMQEFNFIRYFTKTPIGYHSLPIVQLLILFSILLILDTEVSIAARAGFAVLALLTPSIFLSFSDFIVEERNIMLLLACLLLSVKQFENTGAVAWAVAQVLCAQIMLYYKETVFLLLLGFASGRLILRCRDGQHSGWDYTRLWDRESRLDVCLVSLAVLFVFCYFAVMGIHGSASYITMFRYPVREVVLDYLKLDLLVWLFTVVALSRIYLIVQHRTAPWPVWDPLALGGMVYFFAYLYLSMSRAYYLAPVDLIAILYVGRFVLLSWKSANSWSKVGALVLVSIVVLQDVWLSGFAAFERKNGIHAKAAIASVIRARYSNGVGERPVLFFPFAKPYSIMEFVVYLGYRGVPINQVTLAKGTAAKGDRCVEYRSILCRPAAEPALGDLVIVLPDDEASLEDSLVYRRRGRLLFVYKPHPPIPHWLFPFVNGFPVAAGDYSQRPRDRWMDASVTVWK